MQCEKTKATQNSSPPSQVILSLIKQANKFSGGSFEGGSATLYNAANKNGIQSRLSLDFKRKPFDIKEKNLYRARIQLSHLLHGFLPL